MGTRETHKGFDVVRLWGNLEQARVNIDAALLTLVQAHQLARGPQHAELTDELLAVITALRQIQSTLGQTATKPLGETGEPR